MYHDACGVGFIAATRACSDRALPLGALTATGLRHRVVLQTDGGLKTGRDIAIAAALGADEYGFGTAALVALGCVMARQCHANTCPVGIATQREDLRAGFEGTPEMLIGYLRLVAGEVRTILAALGFGRIENLIGRADLLQRREGINPAVRVDGLLADARLNPPAPGRSDPSASCATDRTERSALAERIWIANTDRAFGSAIAGEIAARHGDAGLPDGSVRLDVTGSAGQSFGAFLVPGMRLALVGDANDGVGKGMHGGEIIVAPPARERGRRGQVLVGNAALYGATGGRLFVAGVAGERFAVRNSGAVAVVEGVGDHACEYMTGGAVVILGAIGRNFASGMTGGVVYVCDPHRAPLVAKDAALVVDAPTTSDLAVLRALLTSHEQLTGSRVVRAILRRDPHLSSFHRVAPAATDEAASVDQDRAVNE
jgi:glutamate synthase domain-containing protein 3